MPVWMQVISFILSIVGTVFGGYALVLNHQRTKITKTKENERLTNKRKASFAISRDKEIRVKRDRDVFILKNTGEAEARNLTISFYIHSEKGKSINSSTPENEKTLVNVLLHKIPDKINSNQVTKTTMIMHAGQAPPFEVVLKWEDDHSSKNELKEILQ
ncbi:hypothetical protein M662_03260 [Bacillus sp. SB49]|uniref:hypothetical protein n=1 Tax=Bacillus sp. SB49 TaxID=1071080 RepID=UPI00047BC00B|nr:hypothetical protein [Bacillus sp. SB49]QHT45571.1 hypothetical protein M662_03260 [Bacillus sp. SB49]